MTRTPHAPPLPLGDSRTPHAHNSRARSSPPAPFCTPLGSSYSNRPLSLPPGCSAARRSRRSTAFYRPTSHLHCCSLLTLLGRLGWSVAVPVNTVGSIGRSHFAERQSGRAPSPPGRRAPALIVGCERVARGDVVSGASTVAPLPSRRAQKAWQLTLLVFAYRHMNSATSTRCSLSHRSFGRHAAHRCSCSTSAFSGRGIHPLSARQAGRKSR